MSYGKSTEWINKYLGFVSRWYKVILVVYLCVVGFFLYQARSIQLDSNLYSLFPQDIQSVKNIEKMQDYYGGAANLNLSIKFKHQDQLLMSDLAIFDTIQNDTISSLNELYKLPLEERIKKLKSIYSSYLTDMNNKIIVPLENSLQVPDGDAKKYTKLFLKEYHDIIAQDIQFKYQEVLLNPTDLNIEFFKKGFNDNLKASALYLKTITNELPKNRKQILENFATQLSQRLQKDDKIVFIDYVFNQKFVEDNLLYLLDPEDITYINNQLQNRIDYERRKNILSSLIFVDQDNSDLAFTELKDKYIPLRGSGVSRKFLRLQNPNEVFAGNSEGLTKQFYIAPGDHSIFMSIRTSKGPLDISYATSILELVETTTHQLQKHKKDFQNLEVFPLGPYLERKIDADILSSDMAKVTPIAMFLVCMTIALYFRSIVAVIIVCFPLLSDIMFALGFVSLSYGYLNLVSSFLVAIISGLGVNFGTHLLSRYLEAKSKDKTPLECLQEVYSTIFFSNVTATLTTSAGFFILGMSSFKGFKEFGLTAGIGMLSLLVGIIVAFPSLMLWLESYGLVRIKLKRQKNLVNLKGKKYPMYKLYCTLVFIFFVFTCFSVKDIYFNANFRSLVHKDSTIFSPNDIMWKESQEILKLASSVGIVPIYTPDFKTYKELTEFLLTNRFANNGFRLESLLIYHPDDQKEKKSKMAIVRNTLKSDLINASDDGAIDKKVKFLRRITLTPEISINSVPESIKALFKGVKEGYFIIYYPTAALNGIREIQNYHKDFELINEKFGDKGVFLASDAWIFGDLIYILKNEGIKLLIVIMIVFSIILWLDFRSPLLVVVSLLPLMLGIFFMFGFISILGIELNFFNVLMLPVIAGLGIDHGVHMLHRLREEKGRNLRYVAATTGKAMWLASLQDMIGFAVLLIALYHGLVTTGQILVLGTLGCLFTGSVMVPAIVQWREEIKEKGWKEGIFSWDGFVPEKVANWIRKESQKMEKN